jgi:hypothetical protein
MAMSAKRIVGALLVGFPIAGLLDCVSTVTVAGVERTEAIEQADSRRLHGSWIAENVGAKIGEVTIRLTFPDQGPMNIVAWSEIPFVGEVRNLTEPYAIEGDTISSKAIRGGTKARYGFEGEQLVLQFENGRTIRFDRKE